MVNSEIPLSQCGCACCAIKSRQPKDSERTFRACKTIAYDALIDYGSYGEATHLSISTAEHYWPALHRVTLEYDPLARDFPAQGMNIKQSLREATKVMNCFGVRHRSNPSPTSHPMRRNRQNSIRSLK